AWQYRWGLCGSALVAMPLMSPSRPCSAQCRRPCQWCKSVRMRMRHSKSSCRTTPAMPSPPTPAPTKSEDRAARKRRGRLSLPLIASTDAPSFRPALMPDPLSTHFPRPSAVQLPPGEWATVLDYLCERFPAIDRARWLDRMARHRVLDSNGEVIGPSRSYRAGMQLHYFREVADETPIPVVETILYVDDHLIVVDKPHFLPVVPAGKYVEETLIARLIRRFDNPDIAPLHRIDRHTAGLVLFAANRDSRDLYQALFRERRIEKSYEAIAPALLDAEFPVTRKTRLVAGEPFFRMCEEVGLANTETIINVIERS